MIFQYMSKVKRGERRLVAKRFIRNLPALIEAVHSDVNYASRQHGEMSLVESYLLFCVSTNLSEPFFYVPF